MIYLNWNIEKLEAVLMDSATIRKIAIERAADMDMGESSIAGIVVVRVFPSYKVKIEYGQSGSSDGLSSEERLWFTFSRENIFDIVEDIKPNDDNSFYDELNKTTLSWDKVVDIAVNEFLYDDTEKQMKEYIDELKENAVKCPICGSTNIRKAGRKELSGGIYQEYECKNRNTEEHPIGMPRKFRAEWKF